jgi:hypothetical protein
VTLKILFIFSRTEAVEQELAHWREKLTQAQWELGQMQRERDSGSSAAGSAQPAERPGAAAQAEGIEMQEQEQGRDVVIDMDGQGEFFGADV